MSADNWPAWVEPEELPEERIAAQEAIMELRSESEQERAAIQWAISTGAKA